MYRTLHFYDLDNPEYALRRLENMVNSLMGLGWKPVGNICVTELNQHYMDYKYMCTQAMIKEEMNLEEIKEK